MTRRLSARAMGCFFSALFLPVFAQGAAPVPATEPVPEQAFEAQSAFAEPVAEPAPTAGSLVAEPVAPVGGAGNSAFDEWLSSPDKPSPFYIRWMESLFDFVAPGEPYRRDKLVFTLGTSLGYDNNVFYSATNRISSATVGVNAGIDYHIGTRRLQIDAKLTGGVNYYENRPGGSDDENFGLILSLSYRLMPRLSFSLDTNTAYLSQPSPQLVGGIFQYVGSYFYTDTGFNLNYQMRPRFSLSFSYDYNALKYDDEVINDGSGFSSQTVSLSGNWLLTPRTTFILQYRYNPVSYNQPGIGSQGNFLLAGIEQTLLPRLKYSLMFGAEYRKLENPDPGSKSSYLGPFVEGSMNYNFAPRSELSGNLRLGTEPSGTSGVTIRQTFRASLGVVHYIGSRLSVNGSIGFENDFYDQPGILDFSQDIYTASLSLRYQFALYTSVVLRDDYLVLEGSTENSSYSRNYVSLGLEVTF